MWLHLWAALWGCGDPGSSGDDGGDADTDTDTDTDTDSDADADTDTDSGTGTGTGTETDTGTDAGCDFGRWTQSGDGRDGAFEMAEPEALVDCQDFGGVRFVRIAVSHACDETGCDVHHLDVDYLSVGVGTYAPNPSQTEYPMDAGEFDLYLHPEGDGAAYTNVETSTGCTLDVTAEDDELVRGTFACGGLVYFDWLGPGEKPDRTLDVGGGAFCCRW
jgi:hypothetical protein